MVDAMVPGVTFTGKIQSRKFTAKNPVTTRPPVALALQFSFFGEPLTIPLNGASVQFTTVEGNGSLIQGQINGSITSSDMTTKVLPALAVALNARVQANPTSDDSQALLSLFDNNDTPCTNPNSTTSTGNDGVIGVCEVTRSALAASLFGPDVRVYDENGNYAPSNGTPKNAFSFGIGFTAQATTF